MTGINHGFKMKKICFIIFCFFFSGFYLNAQLPIDLSKFNGRQVKKFAQNAERVGDIYSAIDFYEYYCGLKEDDYKTMYQLAELYRFSRNYQQAYLTYEKVYEEEPAKYPKALYYQSLMAMNLENYEEAKIGFEKFKRKYRGPKDDKEYRRLARYHLEGCELADSIDKSPLDLTIKHLGSSINKPHIEFSPVPLDENSFLYASYKIDSLVYFDLNDSLERPGINRQFYLAKKDGNDYKTVDNFHFPFNEKGVNTGNGAFSPRGDKFYFTKCNRNWQNKMICSIFMSEKKDGEWSEPVDLGDPINSLDYTATQPTIGTSSRTGEEVIYFVSDRPGGKGGLDIWYSIFSNRDQQFREPRNCGWKINTPGDEMTPYYNNSMRNLYFSSNGLPGIGGFDVYKTTGEYRNWSDAQNVGVPVNSPADDLYFILGKKKEDGFFTSNRDGSISLKNEYCCDDIFYFKWNNFIRTGVRGKVYNVADNEIVEMLNSKFNLGKDINKKSEFISGVPVQLYYSDEKTGNVYLIASDTTREDGFYYFDVEKDKNYYVTIKNYGYFDKKIRFDTKNMTFSDTIELQNVGINDIPKKVLRIDLHYEIGKSQLTNDMKEALDTSLLEVLQKIPHLVVQISSHTDDVGEEDFNLELSQKRADNVINYLIRRGIDKERLSAIGYGESLPIAPNKNPDGTDNPAGREKNRRTEIKIIGSLEKYYFDDNYNQQENEED